MAHDIRPTHNEGKREGIAKGGGHLVLTLLRGRIGYFIIAALLGALSAILAFAPHLIIWLIAVDLIAGTADAQKILDLALVLAVAIVARHLIFAASTIIAHIAAFGMQVLLRQQILEHLFRVPQGVIEDYGEGELRTVVIDDVYKVEDALAHLIPEGAAFSFGFLTLIGIMLFVDWQLAIVAFLPVALALGVFKATQLRAADATADYRRLWSRLNSTSAELARAGALLKIYNGNGQISGRLNTLCEEFIRIIERWVKLCLRPGNLFICLIGASLVFVVPTGLFLLERDGIDVATLLFFVIFSFGFADYFMRLNELVNRVGRQGEVLGRISHILSLPNQQPVATQTASFPHTALGFDGVSFGYGKSPVLHYINLTLSPGSVTAIVGPSGSGKTTLARLATRAFDVDQGRVLFGDVDLRQIPPAQWKQNFASVFQDTILFRGTIADNIAMGRMEATEDEIRQAAREAMVDEFVQHLPHGYETQLTEAGEGLSLGQRQRIGIARAIIRQAPLLVLDEATAFADPETEFLVQQALSKLIIGKTVLVVAHRLRTIANAGQIVVLDKGQIVEHGRHDDLLAHNGLYARLWRNQQFDREPQP